MFFYSNKTQKIQGEPLLPCKFGVDFEEGTIQSSRKSTFIYAGCKLFRKHSIVIEWISDIIAVILFKIVVTSLLLKSLSKIVVISLLLKPCNL